MAYRNGTYVAFHAGGTGDPITTDMKYFNLMKAWNIRHDVDFNFVNSHEKTSAVRDSSKKETLRRSLVRRLLNSKHMVLLLGSSTARDTDWVPFEIAYAVDECRIPIIATYIDYSRVQAPLELRYLWPAALEVRIDSGAARVIHIPFRQKPLNAAVNSFSHLVYPLGGSLGFYSDEAYRYWGLM